MTDRYAGQPFLRLLDAYILELIGVLDTTTAGTLEALEPKLRTTFGAPSDASWRQIVRSQMDLDDSYDHSVREAWARQVGQDDAAGRPHDQVGWAHAVVDHLIS